MNDDNSYTLKKPWNGQEVSYPDADPQLYANDQFAFAGYQQR
jgi:lysine 2,3-aminomutase